MSYCKKKFNRSKTLHLDSELQIHEHKNQPANRSCETYLEWLVDHMVSKTIIENVHPFLRDSHNGPLVQFVECNGHVKQLLCSIWHPFPP